MYLHGNALEDIVEGDDDGPDENYEDRSVENADVDFLDCNSDEKDRNRELDEHHVGDI